MKDFKDIIKRRTNKYKSGQLYTEYLKNCYICKNDFWTSKSFTKHCSRTCYKSIQNPIEKFFREKITRLRNNARKRSKDFHLTWEDLLELYNKQKGKCYYTNIEMLLIYSAKTDKICPPEQLSVDRLDSSIGYVKNNIVLCLFCINNFKGEMNVDEFKILLNKIKKYDCKN